MDVSHEPELALKLTEERDYELVLLHALNYARKSIGWRLRPSFRRLNRSLLENYLFGRRPISEYTISGHEANIYVQGIDTFVRETIEDSYATELECQMAAYGIDVMDKVQGNVTN